MTLREMLDFIEFDYEIIDVENEDCTTKKVKLIDSLNVYLGDIDEELWELEKDMAISIIDRMEIYWNDYVYDSLVDSTLNCNPNEFADYKDNGSYEELLKYCKEHNIKNCIVDILYYIVNPDEVIIEELEEV